MARIWHGTVAVLVVAAVAVQLVVAVRVSGSPHETTAGVLRGSSLVGRIIRVFSFFTILSNVLCGVVCGQLAVRPDRDGRAWRAARLASLVGITVTGVVYSSVLARIHQPRGPAETFVNALVHYVIPVMVVGGWVVLGPRPRVDVRTVLLSLVFPLCWSVYTLVRGAIWDWYPYPFVDVSTRGYLVVLRNALLVVIVLCVVAAAFAVGDRLLPPAPARISRPRRPPVHRDSHLPGAP